MPGEWTEITDLDSTFVMELRYADSNNFTGRPLYPCPRCFLRPPAARALAAAQADFRRLGFRLKLWDCYRPLAVQDSLWKVKPDKNYVTPPAQGSMHNRGLAVDVTLIDSTGKELDMGTPYDYFGKEAWPSYTRLPDTVRANRRLLTRIMARHGFYPGQTEWWHFSYRKQSYPLSRKIWPCEKDTL